MKAVSLALALALLAGCASSDRKGGYYKDDGPEAKPPSNLDSIADATPRAEPLHKWANRPYQALGKNYKPLTSVQPFKQRGLASWYGKRFHGQKTSSGEAYDMYKMTAAHPTLPIPSYVRVTRVSSGKSVIVRVNDRGPFHGGRIIDLSYVAAYKLGYIQSGQAEVSIEAIVPGQVRADAR
jgi:rare lipoprotein A